MAVIRGLALAVRFACELSMLAALAWWGSRAVDGPARWVVAIAAPAAAAVVWGLFVAPKAPRPVPVPVRLLLELGLFSAAVLALVALDRPGLAALLGIAAGLTSVVNAATEPDRPLPAT